MSEKILKSRIVHKHDVAANWALATNFSPLKGEIIIYDPDENNAQPRVKVGDGETNVNDLPFVTDISKPIDLIVNMTAGFVTGKGVVYSCDTPFADMWAAYEDGGNVMFFIDGIHTSNVEFLIARADDAKSIHLAYINGSVYLEYTINEDNTVTWKADDLITRTTLQQETGTSTTKVMTQKAVTEALALKADKAELEESLSTLVGDTSVSDQISEAIENSNAVLTTVQELTDEQRAQARANINKYKWRTFSDSYGTYTYAVDDNVNYDVVKTITNTSGNGNVSALEDIVSWINPSFTSSAENINKEMLKYVSSNYDALLDGEAVKGSLKFYRPSATTEFDIKATIYVSHNDHYEASHVIQIIADKFSTVIYYDSVNNEIKYFSSNYYSVAPNLTESGMAADAKIVGDALALKADQTALDEVSALVGDTAVSEQIEEAIGEIPQADWNQSDETAKDYVKNRTHYTEMCRETILPETSLEFTKAGYSGLINVGTFNLVYGESYVVTWDGQEYLCPCYSYSGEAIGDTAILSGTTEDYATEAPFMIWHTGNAMAKETGVHTFKIETLSEEVEVIHKLDEKYLPDSIKVHDWNALENRPFYEEECVLLDEEATVVANSTRVDFNDNAYVLAEGCEYKVIFNGEETYTTAFYEDTDSAIRLMCEFGSLTHDIYYRPGAATKNCWMWVDPTLEHGVYSLKIIDISNHIIKKIDEKYLPDSVKTQPMTIAEIDAICTMDDVTALVIAEYLAEATDNEGNTLTDNENNTYVF